MGWQPRVAVLVGGLMLALATPRIEAYFTLAQVPPLVMRALKNGHDIPAPVLNEAVQAYQSAVDALPSDAILQQDFGRLELRRFIDVMKTDEERDVSLRAASTYFRASIANAPSRAFSWSLEAYARSELSVAPKDVSDLVRMSYYLGPHEPSSMLLRVRISTHMWTSLPDDMHGYVNQDIRGMWTINALRPSLVDIYLRAPFDARIAIRKAAFMEPGDQKIFDRLVTRAASEKLR